MRQHIKMGFSVLLALIGVVLLVAPISWFLWQESIVAEEERIGRVARALGERAERLIVEAIEALDQLNRMPAEPCSEAHLRAMRDAAFVRSHIKAIGYWRADDRLCGAGYVQLQELRPARADRIYESGVIAWWPDHQTAIAGLSLFIIRYGDHDMAIDPRQLLDAGPLENRQAALWVEGLQMAVKPEDAELPPPDSLPVGLTVNREKGRLVSRFSLGTVFPIDIVASEPLGRLWERYWPTIMALAFSGLLLISAWILLVVRYSRRRFSLAGELRTAIAKGQLRAEYQPIIELATGRCVGAEALARWVRDDGERISPDVFIPMAEEAGIIADVTRAVLEATLRDMGRLLRFRSDISININLAQEDLENEDFGPALKAALQSAGLEPASVKLEITERSLINSDAVRKFIQRLRRQGHQVAIDDFGTGYSSLSYLESFEVDVLKIDKSFVNAIERDAVTSYVIGHVIEMAKSLELETVAEGIETEHQAAWLRKQGVVYGQGYLYSRPLSPREFDRFLRQEAKPARRVVLKQVK